MNIGIFFRDPAQWHPRIETIPIFGIENHFIQLVNGHERRKRIAKVKERETILQNPAQVGRGRRGKEGEGVGKRYHQRVSWGCKTIVTETRIIPEYRWESWRILMKPHQSSTHVPDFFASITSSSNGSRSAPCPSADALPTHLTTRGPPDAPAIRPQLSPSIHLRLLPEKKNESF